MKNNFLSGMQNDPIFWKNEQKVPPPITKSIRHVQCCSMEGQALHFYAEISEEKNHNFLQSAIENQQNDCYLMSRSTPGTLCFRTQSVPGTFYLIAQSTQGTQIKLYEFLEHSGTQIKRTRSDADHQTKSTRCAPEHQITKLLLIFNC